VRCARGELAGRRLDGREQHRWSRLTRTLEVLQGFLRTTTLAEDVREIV